MKANTASQTAQFMAFNRALESARPQNKRLFNDPYAQLFLDKGLKRACKVASWPFGYDIVSRIAQHRVPGAVSSGTARTKYIDDLLEKAVNEGIKQLMILGAGFDTRALRLNFLKDIPVIEIDHPDTSRLKLDILNSALKHLPAHVRYLQTDFNTQTFFELLSENNIHLDIPTVIIWEGVTNYLTKEAIDNTFGFLNKFPTGSYLIFTYVDQLVLEQPGSFLGAEKLLNDLKAIEERWTFGFEPGRLADYIKQYGFTLLEDESAKEYRPRYMTGREYLFKGYEFYRVACAKHTAKRFFP